MDALGKDRLAATLLRIDEEADLLLAESRHHPQVVIVGGSALMLADLTSRPATHDIDVLQCDAAVREVIAAHRVANGAVAAYLDHVPYNFEDRLVPLPLPARRIRFMRPSLEDLAVMKLYAWRPTDQEDLESPQLLRQINWDLMDELVHGEEEARASALSPRRYREMAGLYDDYARRHGHEPHV